IPLDGVTFGSDGLVVIKSTTGGFSIPAATTVVTSPSFDVGTAQDLENGANSFLVVYSPTPIVQGTDYAPTDSGPLGLPAGASILDAVRWQVLSSGVLFGTAYGGVSLFASSGTPGAATRFPANTTPLSAAAWYDGALRDTGAGNASTAYDR